MANPSFDDYFANRLAQANLQSPYDAKQQAVAQASDQKKSDLLQKALAEQERRRKAYDDSWLGQLNIDRNSGLGNAVNAAASYAEDSVKNLGVIGGGVMDALGSVIDKTGLPIAGDQFREKAESLRKSTSEEALPWTYNPDGEQINKALLTRDALVQGTAGTVKSMILNPTSAADIAVDGAVEGAKRLGEITGLNQVADILGATEDMKNADLFPKVADMGGTIADALDNVGNSITDAAKALGSKPSEVTNAKLEELGSTGVEELISEGDTTKLRELAADPDAWITAVGNAIPSLVAMAAGGTNAISALSFGASAGSIKDQERETGKPVDKVDAATYALGSGLVNSLLERVGLDAVVKGTKLAKNDVLKKVAEVAESRMAGNALIRVPKAMVGEGTTEGTQQLSDNLMAQQTYNPDQKWSEGIAMSVMGGVGSGGGVSLAAGNPNANKTKTEDKPIESPSVAPELHSKAVTDNDPSVYLDKKSDTYAPDKAIGVLFDHNNLDNVSEETKQSNLDKSAEIIKELSDEHKSAIEVRDAASPEGVRSANKILEQKQEELKNETDPDKKEELSFMVQALKENIEDSIKGRPIYEQRVQKAAAMLSRAQAIHKQMTDQVVKVPEKESVDELVAKVDTAVTEDTDTKNNTETKKDADKLLVLSMASDTALDTETATKLADNTSNSLDTNQRDYLRAYATARKDVNELTKSDSDVHSEVLNGKPATATAPRQMGLTTYRKDIGTALAGKNETESTRLIGQLNNFATSHTNKVAALEEAYKKVKGTTDMVSVVPNREDNTWSVSPTLLKEDERRKQGAVNISSKSGKLISLVRTESNAINSTVKEVEAAHALRFGSVQDSVVSNSSSTQIPEVSSVPTAPVSNEVTQSTDSTVVNSADPTVDVDVSTENTTSVKTDTAVTEQTLVNQDDLTAGKLTAFETDKLSDTATDEDKSYFNRNQIANDMQQVAKKDSDGTIRPLVAAKNFLSNVKRLRDTLPFLASDKKDFTPAESKALTHFVKTAKPWNDKFKAQLHKVNDPKFKYTDLMQSLIVDSTDNKGKTTADLDENTKTAMSYAGYSWLNEAAHTTDFNDSESINKTLGRDENHPVSAEEYRLLSRAGTRRSLLINTLGERAVAALGLKPTNAAHMNTLPKLSATLGAHIYEVLKSSGAITETSIPGSVMAGLNGRGETTDPNAAHIFAKLNRDPKTKEMPELVQSIKDSSKGSQGILNKLFGSDEAPSEPSLTPIPFRQKKAQGTNQSVPKKLAKVLDKKNRTPYTIDQQMYGVASALGTDTFLQIAGFDSATDDLTHVDNIESRNAKNDQIVTQWNNLDDFAAGTLVPSAKGLGQEFYLQQTVWSPFRVGISNTTVNPQQNKTQRDFINQAANESVIDPSDKAQYDNFLLRIGTALGVKTDKQLDKKSLEQVHAKLQDKDIVDAVEAIRKQMESTEEFTQEEKDLIAKAVAKGGENTTSLKALMTLAVDKQAQMDKAAGKGDGKFTSRLISEIDGVTNGPMLAYVLLGVASINNAFNFLSKGGFFPVGSQYNHYTDFRSNPANKDIYQQTTTRVVSDIASAISLGEIDSKLANAIWAITGSLYDSDNDQVTKEGRDIIKKPIQMLSFGAGINGIVDDMGNAFVEAIPDKIQEYARKGLDPAPLIEAINTLYASGSNKPNAKLIAPGTTIEALLQRPITAAERKVLHAAFTNKNSVGELIKNALSSEFESFIHKRDVLTQSANDSFTLYKAAYDAVRAEYLKELNIPVNKQGEPYHDLTAAQEAELDKRMGHMQPLMHTVFSKAENNKDAGLRMSSTNRSLSNNPSYSGITKLANAKNKNGSDLSIRALSSQEVNPGVKMLPLSTHSLDSHISHSHEYSDRVLNLHDSNGTGSNNVLDVARALNRATYDSLAEYSPLKEAVDTQQQIMQGIVDIFNNPDVSQTTKDAIAKAVYSEFKSIADKANRIRKKQKLPMLSAADMFNSRITEAINNARHSEINALDILANTGIVDQYAMEGGQYEVPEARRAEMAERKAKLEKEETPKELTDLINTVTDIINTAAKSNTKQTKSAPVSRTVEEAPVTTEPEMKANKLSPARVIAIVDQLAQIEGQYQKAYKAMSELLHKGIAPREALSSLVSNNTVTQEQSKEIASEIKQTYDNMPASQWGDIGTPVNESNSELVNLLEKRGAITGKQAIGALNKLPLNGFQRALLSMLNKVINPNLTIKYVTPATSNSQVMTDPVSNSRGWYAVKNGAEAIYVLSPDYVHSGLTEETLLHEMTHAAVANIIEQELQAKAANPKYNSEAYQLVSELQDILKEAIKYAEANKLMDKYKDSALKDVHELVAWGVNNREFQADILKNLTIQTKTTNNKWLSMNGMKAFIQKLAGLLFKKPSENMTSGLAVLISNTSGLFAAAAANRNMLDQTHSMASVESLDQAKTYSTKDIYEGLGQTQTTELTPEFDKHLRDVLSTIVENLHGPFGSYKAELMENQPLSEEEVYLKAIDTGVAPFASKTIASGLSISDQESFVMDQIEATVRASIAPNDVTTSVAYKELARTFVEARTKIKPEDFHDGDWTTATQAEKDAAQQIHDFIFNIDNGVDSKSDYLSRFAAMAIGNQQFNQILQGVKKEASKTNPGNRTLFQRVLDAFNQFVNWVSNTYLHTPNGQQFDKRVQTLVEHLAQIESKRQRTLSRKLSAPLSLAENFVNGSTNTVRDLVVKAAKSPIVQNRKNAMIKASANIAALTAQGQLGHLYEGIQAVRDRELKSAPGVIMGVLNDFKGPVELFREMLSMAKSRERNRQQLRDETISFILKSFENEGKDLTTKDKEAISQVFLRTNAGKLLDSYSMDDIQKFMDNQSDRKAEIKKIESILKELTPDADHMIKQIKGLAYFKLEGKITVRDQLFNVNNISKLLAYNVEKQLNDAELQIAQEALHKLLPLYGFEYSNGSVHSLKASKILNKEMARTDKSNGIELSMRLHQRALQDAKERLFQDQEVFMIEGYLPEITDPHTEIRAATDIPTVDANGNTVDGEGTTLINKGWTKLYNLPHDVNDPDKQIRALYVLKDGGLRPWVAQSMALTDTHSKGSAKVFDGVSTSANMVATIKARNSKTKHLKEPLFDPRDVTTPMLAPTLDAKGNITQYRYMMHDRTRNDLLQRDNRFELNLGTLVASSYDKESSQVHNAKVVQTLHKYFKDDFTKRPESYREVGPRSDDPELKAIYDMLPDNTKQMIRDVWGTDHMLVRNDLMDITFGYRKMSLSTSFEKEEKGRIEGVLVGAIEGVYASYARVKLGYSPDRAKKYAMKAATHIRKSEDIWKAIVDFTKDIIVIRTGTVLLGNILSNLTALAMHGAINPKKLLQDHRTAIVGARDYKEHSERIHELQTMLDIGYGRGDEAEMREEISRLKDALARNPVAKLIDAGLMPTIVEDLALQEDPYSYKSKVQRKTEKIAKHIPDPVKKAGNFLLINKGSASHNFLSQTTQLSDFVARYTLFNHLTTRKDNPLSEKEALTIAADTFINYDQAMHRKLQYADDMGFFMFTKYMIRVQRVIGKLLKDEPANALGMLAAENYLMDVPSLIDSSLLHRHQLVPWRTGAFELPSAMGESLFIDAGLSLFR